MNEKEIVKSVDSEKDNFRKCYRNKENKVLKKEIAKELGFVSKDGEPTAKYWASRTAFYKAKAKKELRKIAEKAKAVAEKEKAKQKELAKAEKAEQKEVEATAKKEASKAKKEASEAKKEAEAKAKEDLLNAYKKEQLDAGKSKEEVKAITRVPRNYGKEVELQMHADIVSPYNLERRSGYASIWKKLAEHASSENNKKALTALENNEAIPKECFVDFKKLGKEVNKELKASSKDWYEKNYSVNAYDVNYNSKVIARHPYNKKIESLGQRVIVHPEHGAMLITDTLGTPRILKRKGRDVNGEDKRNVVIQQPSVPEVNTSDVKQIESAPKAKTAPDVEALAVD